MTLSRDLKERVLHLYSSGGMPMQNVMELLNISLGSMHNIVLCHQEFGCYRAHIFRPLFYQVPPFLFYDFTTLSLFLYLHRNHPICFPLFSPSHKSRTRQTVFGSQFYGCTRIV